MKSVSAPSRRHFLVGAAAGVGSLLLPSLASAAPRDRRMDVAILNFALHLEYLDSEYYSIATSGKGLAEFGVGVDGVGELGETTGGAAVRFDAPELEAMARQIAADERAQVALIRETIRKLGGRPIAKPALDLSAARAMGIDPTTQEGFLLATRAFEETAISAYGGTAAFLATPSVIRDSARIMAVEALHAGAVRRELIRRKIMAPNLDEKDIPPAPDEARFFPVVQGLTPTRTPAEVLRLVTAGNGLRGGFFPKGPNGDVRPLLAIR